MASASARNAFTSAHLQVRMILEPQQLAPYWSPSHRLSMAFGPHPRSLMLAAGARLMRATIPGPGSLCRQLTLLHLLPEGESFTAIALPDQVCRGRNHLAYYTFHYRPPPLL